MRSVFVESGSAFYLRVCDFGEQQAQPVYVHTAIFTCWEHPKPQSKRELSGVGNLPKCLDFVRESDYNI